MIFTSELAGFETANYALEPMTDADAPELLAHLSDPAVTEYMDILPLETLEQALAVIAWAGDIHGSGTGVRFAIRARDGGAFLGSAGFNSLVLERGCRGEIAYDLGRAWWGRGVMTEVLPALIDMGFRRLGLQRLEAMVTPGNVRSCRLLERHGFAAEGVLRDYGFWKDQFYDQIVYGRVASAA